MKVLDSLKIKVKPDIEAKGTMRGKKALLIFLTPLPVEQLSANVIATRLMQHLRDFGWLMLPTRNQR
jgi:hypothetical protein